MEVLAALAILAATLALVHQSLASGWSAARRIELESRAALLGRSRLEAVGPEIALREGVASGVEDGMAWRSEVFRHQLPGRLDATPPVPAWWVRVTVTWRESFVSAERAIVLTGLKLERTSP